MASTINSSSAGLTYSSDSSGLFNIQTNGTTALTINGSQYVGVGTSSPAASLDMSSRTDAISLPMGTTAQRPTSPAGGTMRYNMTLGAVEYYDALNSTWATAGGFNAIGGTITTSGSYKIHTFTTSGNFQILVGAKAIEYLIIAGGGSGGWRHAGGGGAGGVLSGVTTLGAGTYPIVIGAGGTAATPSINGPEGLTTVGTNGNDSTFNGLTAIGGGRGGDNGGQGSAGGSGGGNCNASGITTGGAATTGQGFAGGTSPGGPQGGGGGGAGGVGGNAATNDAGDGGLGIQSSITGTATWYASGGAGGMNEQAATAAYTTTSAVQPGGGGRGSGSSKLQGESGTANTGGGGGGGGAHNGTESGKSSAGGAGGSGIVIVRYAI
jgi:hypothetical protein